jgi:oxygen-independent coproporphyrinogen-3 oxidase
MALSAERDPARWAAQAGREGHGLIQREILGRREEAEERLLMGLRLTEGLDLAAFGERSGHDLSPPAVDMLVEDCLLRRDGGRIAATAEGRLVLNALIGTLAGALTPRVGALA